MGLLLDTDTYFSYDFIGPLLEDGGCYSGLGMSEYKLLRPVIVVGRLSPDISRVQEFDREAQQ